MRDQYIKNTPITESPKIFSTHSKGDGFPKLYDASGKDVESIIRGNMKTKESDDLVSFDLDQI